MRVSFCKIFQLKPSHKERNMWDLRETKKAYVCTIYIYMYIYTGLFEIIVGALTTCHTHYTWDRSICIFYLIEQHSKFLLHTLLLLYMWTLCVSTNINPTIDNHRWRATNISERKPESYVTKTWSVVLLNKNHIYCYLTRIVYDKLLKPRQSFRITLYMRVCVCVYVRVWVI